MVVTFVPHRLPRGEGLLLLLLPRDQYEPLLGDLAEEFEGIAERHSVRFAQWWYYRQIVGSVASLLKRRLAKFISMAEGVRLVRRLLHL
jgi:hypothetical protein